MTHSIQLAVVGGGAAGFMGAITAAEAGVSSVLIFEATTKPLEKVRLSGGGRCNVTHACWEPNELTPNYPRGAVALIGSFTRFATGDAVAWFEKRGLQLVVEEDGRMFPKSNSSSEVINCLKRSAYEKGVICSTKMPVMKISKELDNEFILNLKGGDIVRAKKVLIATGGSPSGRRIASLLGHNIVPPAPSLFSLKINSHWLKNCSGISINKVGLSLRCGESIYEQHGRVLITHKGISGPAVLKLSAFAARKLYEYQYKGLLVINWVNSSREDVKDILNSYRIKFANKTLGKIRPYQIIPKRLWLEFLKNKNISCDLTWSGLSKFHEKVLIESLTNDLHKVEGKGPFGEEFVTAGGVELREVDLKSMESRITKGLYFAGEILNVDGVTGGFNFQHCWTSGWLSGSAIAKELKDDLK